MILIISSEKDGHAVEVLRRLEIKGADAHLLDLSNFPQKSQLSIEFDNTNSPQHEVYDGKTKISLSQCNVIWWRRPQPFQLHPEIASSEDNNFAYTECYSAFSGLWRSLNAFWVNHPTHDEDAAKKVFQLKLAQEIGLTIPDTCITNNPNSAIKFISMYGCENVIYKAFSGTEQAWRETRILKENESKLIDYVKYAPVIFQEYIPAKADLRITMIGGDFFTGAIYTGSTSYHADFRMVMDEAHIEPFDLPSKVKKLLREFMSRLGLIYGAIDMRLTPSGEFVFLEINPSGQWLFVEQRTGLPITDKFSNFLLQKDQGVGVKFQ